MELFLVRHPPPPDGAGRCYGRLNLAVDEAAIAHTVLELRAQIPARILDLAPIYSSPLLRCHALARALAAPRQPIAADDLQEMDFGRWEGCPWDDVPRDELDRWAQDPWNFRPGDGESAAIVSERWERWVGGLRCAAIDAAVAITHAGVIRVALAQLGRLTRAEATRASIAFGAVHRLEVPAMRA